MTRSINKKVIIYSPNNIGGVKRVCDDIANGLADLGVEVICESSLIIILKHLIVNSNLIYISSVKGGLINWIAKRSIYILHGWPTNRDYGAIRRIALIILHWFGSKTASITVSVSNLTRIMNNIQFGIQSDAVILNPCHFTKNYNLQKYQRKHEIIFCGKLVEGKGIDKIIEAFLLISKLRPEYNLVIIGDGPLLSLIRKYNLENKITYLGVIKSRKQLVRRLSSAEIFVSLNELEPFGIVFVEAMFAGLKIVCPLTGGQNEFIPNQYPTFRVKNCYDSTEIGQRLCEAMDDRREFQEEFLSFSDFNRVNVASKYLKIMESL